MRPIRILLVANEPDFVRRMVSYLHYSGEFRVVATADTDEMGLLEAQILSLEVILVALELSRPDQMETIRRLRAARPHLGIVVLAWRANSDLCEMVIQAGADSFLARTRLDIGLLASIRQVVNWRKMDRQLSDVI